MAEDLPRNRRTAAPAGSGDPSMEDILASIRRILNEDEPVTPAPPAAAGPEPLALTEDMLVLEPAAAPAPHPVEADPGRGGSAARAVSRSAAPPAPAEAPAAGSPPVEALVAPAVAAAAPRRGRRPAADRGAGTQRRRLARRPDHRGYGARGIAAAAEGMAGRQPAAAGRAPGAGRDRARGRPCPG